MSKKAVLKVGSAVLVNNTGKFSLRRIHKIAADVACLRENGWQVFVVSSGAIMIAMHHLGLTERPSKVEDLQKLAAIGQPRLMQAYERAFRRREIEVAQVLLTHYDFERRNSFLNARHTITSLARAGFVPIINENDTVAVE